MNNIITDPLHLKNIQDLVIYHKGRAQRSKNETAWQDEERKCMDSIRDYCRNRNLPLLGQHMIQAALQFN